MEFIRTTLCIVWVSTGALICYWPILKDLHQTNLLKKRKRNCNNQIEDKVAVEPTSIMFVSGNREDDYFNIRISKSDMDRIGLLDGAIVHLTSSNGSQTVATVDCSIHERKSRVLRNRVECKNDQAVEVRGTSLKNAERVYFRQIAHDLGDIDRNIIDSSLSAFFGQNRPVHQGDIFKVPILIEPPNEFRYINVQVFDIQPSPASIFTPNTLIFHCEEETREIQLEN